MKKILFFAALALVAMAGCTSDENVTVVSPPDPVIEETEPAISFNMGSRTATRADHFGKDAATLLNNKFVVSAFKGDGSTMTVTMPDYVVSYTENTAGQTESNTSDWEYVGTTAVAPSSIAGNKQTIKYWDYSVPQYDFVAYSTSDAEVITDGVPSATNVKVTKIDPGSYSPTYAFSGSKEALAKCYIADMVTAYKEDKTPQQPKFQQEVTLSFRNLASKVRVALYETIPGYSVRDVKFYTSHSQALNSASVTDATLFTAGGDAQNYFYSRGKMIVSYPTIGSAKINETDYNKAHVAFTASDDGKSTIQSFGGLNKVGKDASEADETEYIGRTLPTASFAGTSSPYYTIVLPNEVGTVLELRIDYTLLATDGSGETIKIHGATAYVPAIYAAWKPNYAYTYIFKISDNTNGWTNPAGAGPDGTDPAGLYPITFDAVVVDSEDYTQSTITTVATPSITTYQKGHVYTIDEYEQDDIYVQVMKDGSLVKVNETAHPAQAWMVTANANNIEVSEATVMDALNVRESFGSAYATGRNGLTLTKVTTTTDITAIPGVDGNDIDIAEGDAAVFTPDAAGTYVFTYRDDTSNAQTTFNTAVILNTEPTTGWPTDYYTDFDCTNPAPATFAAGTYYKKYTNRNIVWGAKVIKVQ